MPVRNALGRGAELVGRVCLLLFLGSLWSVLRAAEEPAGWLAPSAVGGGLTGLAVKLASVGAAAAAQREPRTSALRIALRRINDASFMVSLVPLGVMLGRGGSRSGQRAAAVTLAPAGARQEPSRPPSQRPPEDRDRHPLVWNPDARLSNPWWLLHRPVPALGTVRNSSGASAFRARSGRAGQLGAEPLEFSTRPEVCATASRAAGGRP